MRNYLLRFSIYFGVLLIACDAYSQTIVPFVTRYQKSAKGSIDFVSNAIIECNGTGGGGANCVDLAGQLPPTYDVWSQNNDHGANYIDIDGDAATFSSSSDSLNLADCSNILFAGIYWGGRSDDADVTFPNRNQIKIGANGGSYSDVTADLLIDAGAAEGLGNRVYYCFADITEIVKSNPIKSRYTVANVYSRLGISYNLWGGWNIVVVYENDSYPMRNLNVFDGLVNIDNAGTEVEVGITGFETPPSGPVTFDVGVYGYDGDRGFNGDSLLFDGGSGFVPIFNALNPADDIFNFSQTTESAASTSQLPLIHNNISIDADIFSPDNSSFAYIGNSETSATVKVTTNNETVHVQVITLAMDVHEPDIRAEVRVEDVDGGTVEPGDVLKYTVVGKNIGSNPSENTFIVDTLSEHLEFVPGSIEIIHGPNLGAKTDAMGDDQGFYDAVNRVVRVNIGTGADDSFGGTMLNSPTGLDSTVFTFEATVIEDCILLACDNLIENNAYINGIGQASGAAFSEQSTPGLLDGFGCELAGSTDLIVDDASCVFPSDTTVAGYCEGVLFADFPFVGYDYYNAVFSPVTEATAAGLYYGINTADGGCADTIEITVDTFYEYPTTADAGIDLTVCIEPGTATLAGNEPLIGTGEWTLTSGDAVIVSPTSFDSEVNSLGYGINTFQWAITNGPDCPASTDAVTIDVDTIPTVADAGLDQIICDNDIATLDGNLAIYGAGSWSIITGPGSVTTPWLNTSGVTGLGVGTNTFRWTIIGGSCPSTFDEVDLIVQVDSDGDGVCDEDDEDDDNDGIPDLTEGDSDLDGDGLPNYLDLDSDNDGVTDLIEAGGVDADGDGLIDVFTDADSDGLADVVDADEGGTILPFPDSDGDGLFDIDDLDSDNDGTPDIVESGGIDGDGDGIVDTFVDADNDGLADLVDPSEGGTPYENPDTDSDGLQNRVDLDSDNDGIADITEQNGVDINGDGVLDGFVDSDGDGFGDAIDPDAGGTALLGLDSDIDGLLDYLDIDSDNDGIVDAIEAGGVDADGNGHLDGFVDVDNDGFNDLVDTDDNTIPGPGDGGTALPIPNTDGLSGPDYLDIDSDNDGIPDNVEGQASADYIAPVANDADGDGLDDAYDPDASGTSIQPVNTDGTDSPDYIDTDADNDGESDLIEAHDMDGDGIPDTSLSGLDSDNDGLDDAFDTVFLIDLTSGTNAANGTVDPLTDGVFADADNPLVGDLDFREYDSDSDGITDDIDLDDDNDGIPDLEEGDDDNDGDGVPNRLDLDSDNDGIADIVEAGGIDVNGDGVVDVFEDTDADGLADIYDSDNGGTALANLDNDNDGVLNIHDLDSDNDGTPDIVEAGGVDTDNNGQLDDLTDSDGDGFGDVVDTDNNMIPGDGDGGVSLIDPDTDADGYANRIDLDSDNDGIPDLYEQRGLDENRDGRIDGFTDMDGDGMADLIDPDNGGLSLPGADFDLDGIPDYLDLDADNDGIVDAIEAGGMDLDGDGLLDGFVDADDDGFNDLVDTDDDTVPGGADGGTSLTIADTDGEGEEDYRDIDADGDGIPDNVEGQESEAYIAPANVDVDGDGIDDAYDNDAGGLSIQPTDTDGDGIPDFQDLDSDNDGELDQIEGFDLDGDGTPDTEPIGEDSDNDGLDNAFDIIELTVETSFTNGANGTVNPLTDGVFADADTPGVGDLDFREADTDGDGISNEFDLDDDNDGIPDLVEDLNEDGDNNPLTNPTDTDNDGVIDLLDLDSDNDGIPDIVEAGGIDDNGDGKVDNLAEDGSLLNDSNTNGLDDFYDVDNGGTAIPNLDTDSDGLVNYRDLDSDDDGIFDRVEEGGLDSDNDGLVDTWADEDENGIPNYADAYFTGGLDEDHDGIDDDFQTGIDSDNDGIGDEFDHDANGDGWDDENGLLGRTDTDNDGTPDRLDLDSDNDSVPDEIENDPNEDGIGPDDTDNDGIPNFQDDNDDNDQFPTIEEAILEGNNYVDCDNDGIPDYLDPGPCGLKIPTGFSPDGDGINDYFVIEKIEAYPNATLVIFNRWGEKVYETTNGYSNDWDGTSQFGVVVGNQLPEGTYFYVLDLKDDSGLDLAEDNDSGVIKGYVYLKK